MKRKIQIIKAVFAFSNPYRLIFWGTFVLTLTLSLLAPIRPELVKKGVDEYIAGNDLQGLQWILMGYLLMLLLEFILQFLQTYYSSYLAQNIMKDVRKKVFDKVQHFSVPFFDKTPLGVLITRVVSDIEGMAQIFSEGSVVILGDLLKIFVLVGWMFYIDVNLTLLILIPIPILYVVTLAFKKAVNRSFIEVRNQVARINSFVQERLNGLLVIQAFNQQNRQEAKFEQINRAHEKAHIEAIFAYSVFFPIVDVLAALSMAGLIFYGLKQSQMIDFSKEQLGTLMQFIFFINMLYKPIRQLADRFNVFQMGLVNAERIFALLHENRDHEVVSGSFKKEKIEGEIRFENVWFAYPKEEGEPQWVLKNFNLHIRSGEKIALVGETGAGKSTIIQLINRFYDFQKGQIWIDGIPLKDYDLQFLRQQIVTVMQDVFLFSDTIKENVCFGQALPLTQIEEAAQRIGAADFIEQLPEKYDFHLQERGSNLSTGQRQLLSFLRAYLAKPCILVLDEATSSLNVANEKLIEKATAILCQNQTSILIAHRLSTIVAADRILVLEKGEIIQMGKHEELLAQNGKYKDLVMAQLDFK